ncbi:MAG: ABC transporter ATP-binding protein, partial [Acidimicrobiales bacterium]
ALGLLGLLPPAGRVDGGAALLRSGDGDPVDGDTDLRRIGRAGLSKIRGRRVALVPQAAMSLLDPTMTVVRQVGESAELTRDARAAAVRAIEMLERVGIAGDRHGAYPHELSGGQRQRVVIAMALANEPSLLVADEPTAGLDVVTQIEILDLLDELRSERGLDLVLISHDLPLMAARSHDLAIMYAGRIVEAGPTSEVLAEPIHPYTILLSRAFPALGGPAPAATAIPGEAPIPGDPRPECAFAPRCPVVESVCHESQPLLLAVDDRHDGELGNVRATACHLADRVAEPEGTR